MKGLCGNHKLCNGLGKRFQKGMTPWNKGKKGYKGANRTSFKPGQMPKNYLPVGSERVTAYGYTEIKVADPKKWRAKHVCLWEQEHGPVPKGHVVMFADKNRCNFSQDNLLLVSRAELATINQCRLIFSDIEATKAGLQVARLKHAISRRQKETSR
jgi:hypothetical protein